MKSFYLLPVIALGLFFMAGQALAMVANYGGVDGNFGCSKEGTGEPGYTVYTYKNLDTGEEFSIAGFDSEIDGENGGNYELVSEKFETLQGGDDPEGVKRREEAKQKMMAQYERYGKNRAQIGNWSDPVITGKGFYTWKWCARTECCIDGDCQNPGKFSCGELMNNRAYYPKLPDNRKFLQDAGFSATDANKLLTLNKIVVTTPAKGSNSLASKLQQMSASELKTATNVNSLNPAFDAKKAVADTYGFCTAFLGQYNTMIKKQNSIK